MQTTAIRNDPGWKDLGSWINAYDFGPQTSQVSVQDLRERIEAVFDWNHDAELQMRTPHVLFGGETPWDVLYYTAGGAARIVNILDLVEQRRLIALPKTVPPLSRDHRVSRAVF